MNMTDTNFYEQLTFIVLFARLSEITLENDTDIQSQSKHILRTGRLRFDINYPYLGI